MQSITKYWRNKMIALEQQMLRYYGCHEHDVQRVDGSFMCLAFRLGWRSCLRRAPKYTVGIDHGDN